MLGIRYTIREIATAAYARDLFQGIMEAMPLQYISYDSRNIHHGEKTLFIALKTENRDGHDFVEEAYEKGVRNFLVARKLPFRDVNYILSDDPLETLQLWARYHRRRFDYPVVAITGSNGKTTVKEWLATLCEQSFQVVKSPMSYNSQLGVPVSVLQMTLQAGVAIIEAGISKPGEMEILEQIIRPDISILTHMGPAHSEGFSSEKEKLEEKIKLFGNVKIVLTTDEQSDVQEVLHAHSLNVKTTRPEQESLLNEIREDLKGEANLSNARLAILAAQYLGVSDQEIKSRLPLLRPVTMRLEMITDNPEVTVINDSYNSDVDSVRNAFHFLLKTPGQPKRQIILSDIPHQGENQSALQKEILREAVELVGKENIRTIGPVFASLGHKRNYLSTDALIHDFRYEDFAGSTVLVKGARKFELERIIPLLNRKLNATRFHIDLNALSHNFRLLKSRLPEGTKTMCMVKAASYGSGTWEIAQALVAEGADYLTVAYASEGIELRNAKINLPIMVMNPDPSSIETLIQYDIEPEVSNMDFLKRYVQAARLAGLPSYPLHLKIETGMGRLGFSEGEMDQLFAYLLQFPDIRVISIMSHLAAVDDPGEDGFSQSQVDIFQKITQRLKEELGIQPMRHILNTAGVLRFPQYAFEMVRIGIGLYGINPVNDADFQNPADFIEIGSLHSTITQVQTYPAGTSIGYGRSQITERDTRIATIPIGYADGIPRSLGNGKIAFLVRGQKASTFGRICMDMLMLDITDIPDAVRGDDVVLIGHQGDAFMSVNELAEAADTIAYEILVRISPRVRRVYERE